MLQGRYWYKVMRDAAFNMRACGNNTKNTRLHINNISTKHKGKTIQALDIINKSSTSVTTLLQGRYWYKVMRDAAFNMRACGNVMKNTN